MKKLAIIVAAIGSLAVATASHTSFAQSASAAQPDPVRLALARQLQNVSGGREQANAEIKGIFASFRKGVAQSLPPDQSRLAEQINQDLEDELIKLTPQLLDLGARISAENYTEKELRDLLAFQTSETGRSIARKSIVVRSQVMAETMPLVMNLMPAIAHRTAPACAKRSTVTADQHQIVASALAKALPRPTS